MQDYEKNERMLLIYDDTPNSELTNVFFEENGCDMLNVKYIYSPIKKTIYEKRNELNRIGVEEFGAEYLICMDDDDLYTETRVSDAVNCLDLSGDMKITGSNRLYLLYINTKDIYEVRVKKKYYASNNTMAYRSEYLLDHSHEPIVSNESNEEESFTNNFEEPLVQQKEVVLMVCHDENTVNKNKFKLRVNKVMKWKKDELLRKFLWDDEKKKSLFNSIWIRN